MILFNNEKHYNTLNNYYRYIYQTKVFKIPINGGFTCPNIDGTVASGGCTFCTPLGSGDFAGKPTDSIKVQFSNGKKMMQLKWPKGKYIPYFQANTNTHAPLQRLQELFEAAASLDEDVVMISIATRPDSLPDDVISYLADLNKRIPIQIELGLQTIHETTSKLINRAHDLSCFNEAVFKLRDHNIEIVAHIINGLPGETPKMMIQTIKYLKKLDIQGVKIHMLHLMNKTKMGADYLREPWKLLTQKEYVEIVVQQIRHLNPNIIIHRLTGDAPTNLLIAPLWTKKKFVTLNEIDKIMRENSFFQGDLHHENN